MQAIVHQGLLLCSATGRWMGLVPLVTDISGPRVVVVGTQPLGVPGHPAQCLRKLSGCCQERLRWLEV